MFAHFAQAEEQGQSLDTMDTAEWMQLAQQCGLVEQYGLTKSTLLRIFAAGLQEEGFGAHDHEVELEASFEEFLEMIVVLATYVVRDPFLPTHNKITRLLDRIS
eukprot:TRINITY_DN65935_c10_g3_i1.p2 TRINITY_DN65935_c10_g3~~TRINITY_DN65935_c10_g3_i1.p2  ORF type:complete len:104 (-),score=50.41 TRINITY_DN65935_c10_g3_i1:88-399(-)